MGHIDTQHSRAFTLALTPCRTTVVACAPSECRHAASALEVSNTGWAVSRRLPRGT